jgi:hypothetical protein
MNTGTQLVFCALFVCSLAIPSLIDPTNQSQLVVQLASQSDLPALKKFLKQQEQSSNGGIASINIEEMLSVNTYKSLMARNNGNTFLNSLDQLSRYIQVTPQSNLMKLSGMDVDMHEIRTALQAELLQLPFVTAAYVKPAPSVAVWLDEQPVSKSKDAKDQKTPLFVKNQLHLNGPGGFNVSAMSEHKGGNGEGVQVLDVEFAWTFYHEDLTESQGKVVVGPTTGSYADHGSAVVGVIAGNNNDFGIVGIAPKVKLYGASVQSSPYPNVAKAIIDATTFLSKGDVILIELHSPGPRCNFQSCGGQRGYIAMEFWPDNFHALKAATELGITVTEAAGNGAENFDDEIYYRRPTGFPIDWQSPFNRTNADSGCILVGAGAPPPGTHGAKWGADRSRLDFSNYGSAVDVQGWGREVTTLGYGDLFRSSSQPFARDYTNTFAGTSSATPCVAGCVAALQGAAKAGSLGKDRVLSPHEVRQLLRTTGAKQQDEPGRPATQHIGNRPNLYELTEAAKSL